ncbi:5-oxoprolinase subunit PxpB [Bacillus cereus]|uniref:5-oxoprolinase subunit PxpB n=1 Tax=Bacillus cereus TaxID=1396 RepID=UPI00103D5548|nr:5-oxoprolinase subunit PxpB [Bacillus cereus]MCE7033981.1 5-oxoprolinase subunit PxpB [Bacillus cereus]MCU9556810.1 5-oxoprolinase subunit PxpB [Bacillus cereus]QOW28503.1 5-oxoprolinase subunit PxpB [Bacillus cereus]TBX56159.1 5-oxoprolinase subunit PxpB [Bacillus cereus]HDR4518217.1 5-oxoprolinase subunit PxpB [Bacillus cereus]
MKFSALGDQAIIVTFGEEIGMDVYEKVQRLFQALQQHPFTGMIECVPSFTSLAIYYNLYEVWKGNNRKIRPYDYVCQYIARMLDTYKEELKRDVKHISIPVCYGGEYGPDLEEVAHYHGLQVEDVIRIHSETTYFVYMLGFTPGFPYLGGLSEELETPRKEIPRLQISPGSVGIGGNQTGIYPLETPGGWNIIGRTPISLFNPEEETPTFIQSGMYLRFIPITKEEYVSLEGAKEWM